MPLDPSISLKLDNPNPGNLISGFLDIGRKNLELQKAQQTFGADVAQRNAESARSVTEADVAARTADPRVSQQQSAAGTAAAQMSDAQLSLLRNHVATMTQQMETLREDPELSRKKVIDSIVSSALTQGAPTSAIAMSLQGIPDKDDPAALKAFITKGLTRAQAVSQHLATITPTPAAVATNAGTQFVNTNPNAGPVAAPMGAPLTPPNQLVSDTSGGTAVVNPAQRTAQPLTPGAGAQPMAFPQGETRETQAQLQGERTQAQQVSNSAGQLHDINRSIVQEVDKGITTGTLGQLKQKLASATGFNVGSETGTDYNVLGKMLERSALQAAQGMGPHTNAGLEAQVRANGSTDYTPAAIRKIAVLNDAIVTGSTLYQAGLENAIANSPNGVFTKRQFDRNWASAMNPTDGVNGVQALRLKNAVDNSDPKGVIEVLAEVGGRGSKGANALAAKLRQLRALSGE